MSVYYDWVRWICCPWHAGVSGNERADRLASSADITSGLQFGRAEVLRLSEAWGTFWTWTGQSITALIAWRKEEWRKEVANIPPSMVENNLCSTRQILALFWGQPWGDCWDMGQSVMMPSWAETETETEVESLIWNFYFSAAACENVRYASMSLGC